MTPEFTTPLIPDTTGVVFLPLGGAGEIGMNLTLYGYDGAWLMVDLGVTFGGDDFPDHPLMMPDPEFIVHRRDHLAGIVLTHGHEDHIGALPYLWRRLRCPVYASPFTLAIARQKLARVGLSDQVPLFELRRGQQEHIGPFTVEPIAMTHSIPEASALLIETPPGKILHTGDWKLDDRPVVGRSYDRKRLWHLRGESLLAMVCDSTNAVVPGHTGSEWEVAAALRESAAQVRERLVVTCFASNLARLVTLARVAAELGRRFAVLGQTMERTIAIGRQLGYWPDDLPALVPSRHVGFLPRHEVLIACTGSQGEPRSALSRLASDRHRDLELETGDTVLFSAKAIPGNLRTLARLRTRLHEHGIRVITEDEAPIHVSGHPAADDLQRLYEWIQPPLVIPVHGTPRHLAANATIARACHVPQIALARNGTAARLSAGGYEPLREVPTGRLTQDPEGRLRHLPAQVLAQMHAREN